METQIQSPENKVYQPQPNDRVMCDPTFTRANERLKDKPNMVVEAVIISTCKFWSKVEIIDERKPNSLRIWENTDRFGSTTYVLNSAMQLKTATA